MYSKKKNLVIVNRICVWGLTWLMYYSAVETISSAYSSDERPADRLRQGDVVRAARRLQERSAYLSIPCEELCPIPGVPLGAEATGSRIV